MPEIITIGETMAALAPKEAGFLRYADDFKMRIAGAESNLAIGVSKLGHTAGWISCLGKDELGYLIQNSIRSEGVDTTQVVFDTEHQTGVMFKQVHRSYETEVFYYRENSAASHMEPALLSNDYLKTGKILHLTGITPVLSPSCERMIETAFAQAKSLQIPVSFDPNIRRKLWKGIDFSDILKRLSLKSDIVLIGLDEAEALFKTKEPKKKCFLFLLTLVPVLTQSEQGMHLMQPFFAEF